MTLSHGRILQTHDRTSVHMVTYFCWQGCAAIGWRRFPLHQALPIYKGMTIEVTDSMDPNHHSEFIWPSGGLSFLTVVEPQFKKIKKYLRRIGRLAFTSFLYNLFFLSL